MPRTKGSKNHPKTYTTNDYASQIAEKQESMENTNRQRGNIPSRSNWRKGGPEL